MLNVNICLKVKILAWFLICNHFKSRVQLFWIPANPGLLADLATQSQPYVNQFITDVLNMKTNLKVLRPLSKSYGCINDSLLYFHD